jgi:hypothetical protein
MATKRNVADRLFQFNLASSGIVQLTLPASAEILRGMTGLTENGLFLVVRMNPDPKLMAIVHTFAIYENGESMWDCEQKYIGTLWGSKGQLQHVFELFDFTYAPGTLSVK